MYIKFKNLKLSYTLKNILFLHTICGTCGSNNETIITEK